MAEQAPIVPTMHQYRPAHLVLCPSGDRFVFHDRADAEARARLCAKCPPRPQRSPR